MKKYGDTKVITVGLTTSSTSAKRAKVPIALGTLEVADIHLVRARLDVLLIDQECYAEWMLWKKLEGAYPKAGLEMTYLNMDDGVICSGNMIHGLATTGGRLGPLCENTNFIDCPVTVIRPPQLIVTCDTDYQLFGLHVYYSLRKITRDEMAKLMVQDHPGVKA